MIILPNGLTPQEIRILQEYRRMNADTLTAEAIKAIRLPSGSADPSSLVLKRFLSPDGETFSITQKGKDFLAIEASPEVKAASGPATAAPGSKPDGA